MKRYLLISLILCMIMPAVAARADEEKLDRLFKILRENGNISQEQYEELTEAAEETPPDS